MPLAKDDHSEVPLCWKFDKSGEEGSIVCVVDGAWKARDQSHFCTILTIVNSAVWSGSHKLEDSASRIFALDATHVELLVLRKGIERAAFIYWRKVMITKDASLLISAVNDVNSCSSNSRNVVLDILDLCFSAISVVLKVSKVAHKVIL